MNLNQLRYFLTIVKTRSFSDAAYDLFISQSSISKQIKSLEDELGVTLFDRTSYQRFLTPAGKIFLRYAEAVLSLHGDLLIELEPFRSDFHGTLRIGSIPILSSYGIGENLARFQAACDEGLINFDMQEGSQFDVMRALHNSEVDLALVRTDHVHNLKDYLVLPYAIDELVAVCDKRHSLARRKRVSLAELSRYPLYLIGKKSTLHHLVVNAFERQGVPLPPINETSRHKILLELLPGSQVVSILPQRLIDLKNHPSLTTILLDKEILSHVSLIRLKEHKSNKITEIFWEFWRQNCTMSQKEAARRLHRHKSCGHRGEHRLKSQGERKI